MSPSPYQITLSRDNKGFTFTTDSRHEYLVYFEKSDGIFADTVIDKFVYYFGFSCKPPLKVLDRDHDPRVGVTIMHIIANFLSQFPEALLAYICSSMDGQDRNRHISFGRWYGSSPLKEKFLLHRRKTGDSYCGIIYDKKHPEINAIENLFTDVNPGKPGLVEEAAEMYFDEDEQSS